jgi:nitrous oxidase accessory protein NosD
MPRLTVFVFAVAAIILAFACQSEDAAPSTSSTPAEEVAAAPATFCATSLQALINASSPGSVLDLTGCRYEQPAKVTRPLTLRGGTLSIQSSGPWEVSLLIDADNVTIDGWTFLGGGVSLSILERSNVRVLNSTFHDHIGTPIAMFGPVRDVVIEGNEIINSRTIKSSAVIGRGAEEPNPCSTVGRGVAIRDNYIDQGPGSYDESATVGWFGIELKCFEDSVIDGNHVTGGHTLISLPDSNRITVQNNLLDVRGFAYWGVEIPQANDIAIYSNTVLGDGSGGNDAAFSANSGSQRMTIRYNTVRDVRTLVDSPINSIVTDNCLVDVLHVWEYSDPESGIVERNGPC